MNKDIMTDEYAAMIVEKGYVGKTYRPSNGTEGEIFMEAYCYKCEKDKLYDEGEGCEIITLTMCFHPKDKEYPKEWIYNEQGQPTCTAFVQKEEPGKEALNPNQLTLF